MDQAQGSVPETHHPYAPMKDTAATTTKSTLPPPATHTPRVRRTRSRCHCVISTCGCFLLALVLTIGTAVLIEYLLIHPRNGHYDIHDAHLQTFNLTHNEQSQTYSLDTDLALTILFRNPNHKMGFDVKGVNVRVSSSGVEVGRSADVPPFHQGKRNDTLVSSRVWSEKVLLSEGVGRGLQENVTLLVEVNAKVRHNHHMLVALHPCRAVHLRCDLSFEEVDGSEHAGNLVGKKCNVKRG